VGKTAYALIAGLLACLLSFAAAAQQPQDDAAPAKMSRPLWTELSPKQQAVLAPLAAEWDNLDTVRRKKWVTIANRYPKMKADEQARLQRRMQAWAALTPAQRREARENYKTLRQLPRPPRGELRQKWDQQKQAPVQADPQSAAGDTPGK
jgi:Protein of unknown function (DUF3106)